MNSYRITLNFIHNRGIDRLQEFENDLNRGFSIEKISEVLLHCSSSRAYKLRDAIFKPAWVLKDASRECVEDFIRFEQTKISRAIEYSTTNIEEKTLKIILCKASNEASDNTGGKILS